MEVPLMRASRLVLPVFFAASLVRADSVRPSCKPFPLAHMNDLMKPVAFDGACGPVGSTTNKALQAQNTAKNNLCASGTPVVINITTLDALQAKTGTITEPPLDRSPVPKVMVNGTTLVEGMLVTSAGTAQKAN